MKTRLFYLNSTGHRWVIFDETGRHEQRTFTTKSGAKVERRVNYYSSFGNFATANISYKGRRINVFLDTLLDD